MAFHVYRHRRRRGIAVGSAVVGTGGLKPASDALKKFSQRHQKDMERVRLTGHTYLKPPGISKSLKTMQEELAFRKDADEEDDVLEYETYGDPYADTYSERPTNTDAADSTEFDPTRQIPEEDLVMVEEDANDDETVDANETQLNASFDYTMPTFDASIVSAYHR